ncbi:2881_t:CDS:2, partial [Racocetra fulgida]
FKRIIKVAWMIVGFHTDFNFRLPLKLKFSSCTIKSDRTEKIRQKDLSKVFKVPKNKMYSLLGICAFRYQDGDEDVESTIIIGHHLCKNEQTNQYVFIKIEGKEVDKPLEMHGILSTDRTHLEMTWNKWINIRSLKAKNGIVIPLKKIEIKLFFSLLCEEKDCSPYL